MKNKQKMIACLLIGMLLIPCIILGRAPDKNNNLTAEETEVSAVAAPINGDYSETINNASPDIRIPITSSVSLSDKNKSNYISVYNHRDEPVDVNIEKTETGYNIAPKGSYEKGYTYTILLLNDLVNFEEQKHRELKRLSLTTEEEEHINIQEKENVIHLTDVPKIIYEPEKEVNIKLDSEHKYEIDQVLIFPVYYRDFNIQKAYKVISVADAGDYIFYTMQEATLEETYDELEMAASYAFPLNSENIRLMSNEDIGQQILESPMVQNLTSQLAEASQLAETNQMAGISQMAGVSQVANVINIKPVLTVGVEINNGNIIAQIGIGCKNFYKKLSFNATLKLTIDIGAESSLSLFTGQFLMSSKVTVKTEGTLKFTYEDSMSSVDVERIGDIPPNIGKDAGSDNYFKAMKEIRERLADPFQTQQEMPLKLFNAYIPSPVAVVGILFEGYFKISLTVKAEAYFKMVSNNEFEAGTKREGNKIRDYKNIKSSTNYEVGIQGEIELKVGFGAGLYLSVAGILNAGIDAYVGVYVKVAGFFKYMWGGENRGLAGATYLEAGFFFDLSLAIKLNLGIFKAEFKLTLLPLKAPLFFMGSTKMVSLEPENNSIEIPATGQVKMPAITVTVEDMFTLKKEISIIPASEYKKQIIIVDKDNRKFTVDDNGNIKSDIPEFEDVAELRLLSPRDYYGDEKYPALHIYVGEQIKTFVTVTKKAIPIEEIELNYVQVKNDPDYKLLNGFSANYIVRDANDFQIGRLVRVEPNIYPFNATYKTLQYTVTTGSQYISNFRMFEENGITFAEFRIINDEAIIGREIRIDAVSIGYTGENSGLNVAATSSSIFAREIPAEEYEVQSIPMGMFEQSATVTQGQISQAQTATLNNSFELKDKMTMKVGERLTLAINPVTIHPMNATRGAAYERMAVEYGDAEIVQENGTYILKISEDAEIGTQVKVYYAFGDNVKEMFFNIVKTPVESIVIDGGNQIVSANDTRVITVDLIASGIPSVKEVVFIMLAGKEIATIAPSGTNQLCAILKVGSNAKHLDKIAIVAIIDGLISETVEYTVNKIPVENVFITCNLTPTGSIYKIEQGAIVYLSAIASPVSASIKDIEFIIVEEGSTIRSGRYIADLDAYTGIMRLNYYGKFGDRITVVAVSDGVESARLVFEIAKRAVTSIHFIPDVYNIYLKAGTQYELSAVVNEDASIKGVTYSIVYGGNLCTLNGDILSLVPHISYMYDSIGIKATSLDNPNISIFLSIIVYDISYQVYINGQAEEIYANSSESLYFEIKNSNGQIISPNNINMTLMADDWQPTDRAYISNNTIILSDNAFGNYDVLTLVLESECMYEYVYSIITIYKAPNYLTVANIYSGTPSIKAGETISISVSASPSNIAFPNNLGVKVCDGKGVAINSIGANGKPQMYLYADYFAAPGETITVKPYWFDNNGNEIEGAPFVFEVKTGIETVEISNIKVQMNLAESIRLDTRVTPYGLTANSVSYHFTIPEYSLYASLDSQTGELTINSDSNVINNTIKIYSVVDGVRSKTYEIEILNPVVKIELAIDSQSLSVEYISALDAYVLSPDGFLKIQTFINLFSGQRLTMDAELSLCSVGQQNLNIYNGIISVRQGVQKTAIAATLTANYAGVLSEPISIYVPQRITTPEEFANISRNIFAYYVLENDIDFLGINYTPIKEFYGVIDGNGYSLLNVCISALNNTADYGLFIDNYGVLMNLNANVKISFYDEPNKYVRYVGVFAARNFNGIINCHTIESASHYIFAENSGCYVGGIAGYNEGTIRQCYNFTIIYGYEFVGGIVGFNIGIVENCISGSNMLSVIAGESDALEGIIGYNQGTVTNTYFWGTVFIRLSEEIVFEKYEDIPEDEVQP